MKWDRKLQMKTPVVQSLLFRVEAESLLINTVWESEGSRLPSTCLMRPVLSRCGPRSACKARYSRASWFSSSAYKILRFYRFYRCIDCTPLALFKKVWHFKCDDYCYCLPSHLHELFHCHIHSLPYDCQTLYTVTVVMRYILWNLGMPCCVYHYYYVGRGQR